MQQATSNNVVHDFFRLLLLVVVVLFSSANTAFSGQIVKYLPGYKGELPFKLETGYITVNETELFYYFIKSQGNPTEDPLIFWLSGGPGCSSFNGIVYEIDALRGYIVGSPDEVENSNSRIVFAHRMALISDELYKTAKTVCLENYVNIDPANTACILVLDEIEKCTRDLFGNDILEPKCAFASPKEDDEFSPRRYLREDSENAILQPQYNDNQYWCRAFNYSLAYIWANDDAVQEALHVRKGLVSDWKRCNKSLSGYTKDVQSVIDIHRFLSKHRLEVLVNSGDRDMVVPFVGTEWWIKQLSITIVNDWRPWFVNGQVAGYTRKYSEDGYRLTYVTIKGAGHTAPEYYRREAYEMFMRFINYYEM